MHKHKRAMQRTRAALFGLTVLGTATSALAQDEWWGRDKALHFGVSGVLAGGGYALGTLFVDSHLERAAVGGGLGLGAGVAKEVYDEIDYGGASYKDLVFDVAGVAVGVVAAWLLDVALSDEKREPIAPSARGLTVHF